MASPDIGTVDLASLERFQTELIEAGFEPWRGNRRIWIGPLAESLKDLTTAKTMRIVFVDGWPFRNPHLYVDGLDEWHLSAGGDVCLWTTGATPSEWLTVKGYMNRIDEWAKRAKSGFAPEDFALELHPPIRIRREPSRRRLGACGGIRRRRGGMEEEGSHLS